MPDVGGRGLSEEHARETARLLNEVRPDFIRVRTFALHPQSPVKKMVDAGTFLPMTDEEIIAEIRLLVSCFDEIHSYFSCGDYSPNLLMQVNGYLDKKNGRHAQRTPQIPFSYTRTEKGLFPDDERGNA